MPSDHDLLLSGGTVVDGTGGPPVRMDVGIRAGRISALGRVDRASAHRVIDVDGAVVSPGFIDLHSHADFTIERSPAATTQVMQGVTTLVTGNCGFSPFPVTDASADLIRAHTEFLDDGLSWQWRTPAEYAAVVSRGGLGVNLALQVGHGALRMAVLGAEERAPEPGELERMRALLRECGDDVVGWSTGLVYPPCSYADTAELAEVADQAAASGLLYSTHIRNENSELLVAIDEALDVARRSGVRLQISHLKAMGQANWGLVGQALERIRKARGSGVDVAADQYPYAASSTTLTTRLPGWAMAGGVPAMLARLEDPETAARIEDAIAARQGTHFLPDRIMIAHTGPGPYTWAAGLSIAEVATELGRTPAATVLELLRGQRGAVGIISHGMAEEDVETLVAATDVAVASDGWILCEHGSGMPHPRSFGTFARVLGHYVRERGAVSLSAAIHKMTALPARRCGLAGRGVLEPGAVADLAVFDPDQVVDRSTYAAPWRLAAGIVTTIVAGQPVVLGGERTDAMPGVVVAGAG